MKRQSPLKALRVAQMRCRAAVTITITGKAGSGKSTIAEYLTSELAEAGFNVGLMESDDSVHTPKIRAGRDGLDDRFVLVAVEDSNAAYKPKEPTPEPAKETPCSDCTGCEEDEEDEEGDLPPIIKAILVHAMLKAKRQGM